MSSVRSTPTLAVWRWHFWAGLFVAPVLLLLAVTGALYLFDDQIERLVYRPLMVVAPGPALAAASVQQRAVETAYAGSKVRRLEWPHDSGRSAQWGIVDGSGVGRTVFVDPYRAVVLGDLRSDRRLMSIVSDLHGELMIGRVGDWIVELAASWTLVLLATGLWLWWPRHWKLRGVLVPRIATPGRRRWRDLHAIPAAGNALLVALLVLSGLPWSGFWGEQLARLGTLSPHMASTPNFGAPAPSPAGANALQDAATDPHAAHRHDPDDGSLPWTIRHAPVPAGSGAGIGIDVVIAAAARRDMLGAPRLRVMWPVGPQGVFTVSHTTDRAQDQRTLYVDPADGRVLDDIGWARYSELGKAVEWGVMTHMGRQFGLANQLAGLAVCLLIVTTLATGLFMWWRRKPAGGLGAPRVPTEQRLPGGLKALLLALAILFPLVGISILLVVAGETLARRLRRRGAA